MISQNGTSNNRLYHAHQRKYAVYNAQLTTMKQVLNTFLSSYDCNHRNDNIRFFSKALNRYITSTDMDTKMADFKFDSNTQFKLQWDAFHIENADAIKTSLHQKLDKSADKYTITCKRFLDKDIELEVCTDLTISELKYLIFEKIRMPVKLQQLIHNRTTMADTQTLSGVQKGDQIHLVIMLRGGMYHETSGKNGNYKPLQEAILVVEPDLKS